MLTNILVLIAGFILLIRGADYLVKGAASMARRLGVRAFVVGLTVVAFGTSAPELVVNVLSATSGSTGLALGNVLGSNLANILLILGIAAIISPVILHRGTVWKELPLLLLASVLVVVLGSDIFFDGSFSNIISRIDGIVLLSFFVIFLYYTHGASKGQSDEHEQIDVYDKKRTAIYLIGGLAGLALGGKFIVDSAVFIAQAFSVSEHVIGATIVAVGTSLPELATTIVAAIKKHTDIAVGNVVGSNLFNVFFVLGTTVVIRPLAFDHAAWQDAMIVLGITLILFMSLFVGKRHHFEKWQGVTFVGMYLAYIVFSVFRG
ncbi:calcium/sodium antiporter [Patescibacteria group bacterium]|nr:calcium/sodium antiporter [Patescibacteria group bacterium]MBU1705202.1 calcium/sodium antiporter [Patescibacteria group bacterium]